MPYCVRACEGETGQPEAMQGVSRLRRSRWRRGKRLEGEKRKPKTWTEESQRESNELEGEREVANCVEALLWEAVTSLLNLAKQNLNGLTLLH